MMHLLIRNVCIKVAFEYLEFEFKFEFKLMDLKYLNSKSTNIEVYLLDF